MQPVRTLAEAIVAAAATHPDNGFTFQAFDGRETFYAFPAIERATAARAAALQRGGLKKGDRLGMVVIDPENFVLCFLAALRIGVIPVPVYPPTYLGSIDVYMAHTAGILASARVCVLLVSAEVDKLLRPFVGLVPGLRKLVTAEGLQAAGAPRFPEITPDDVAFLQFTSGSTSNPKGVVVTHRNLISNIDAFAAAGLRMDPRRDKGISWLPLYHDMGLIGFVLGSICGGIPVVFIPTLRFIKNVSVWMDAIHRHRGTVSFAPNFAFALAARRPTSSQLDGWDLSCVKALGCAAEPIRASTIRQFSELFASRCKLPRSAVLPAYGLAEATLAVAMKPLHEEFSSRRVDAESFQQRKRAVPAVDGSPGEEHVSCGVALPGFEIAVTGEDGAPLPDAAEGEIRLRGPSICPAYYGQGPVAADGWLHTGDLGYLLDGRLYVTGRSKDLIILNGRNIHPQTVEWAASRVRGIRAGNVVAFSRNGENSEELVVVAETRVPDKAALAEEIAGELRGTLQLSPADVILLDPGALPKTSSGKLQRAKTRQQYLSRELGTKSNRLGTRRAQLKMAGYVARSFWGRLKSVVAPR